jgi:hypothetical protein
MSDNPNALRELMELDPLELTDENIDTIIEGYRGLRAKYNLGDTKAGSPRTRAKPAALQGLDTDGLKAKLSDKLGKL